MEISTKQ